VAYLKPAGDWASLLDVTMVHGAAVVACDAERRTVCNRDGKIFGYDRLLLATAPGRGGSGHSSRPMRVFIICVTSKTPCICASRSIVRTASSLSAAASSGWRPPAPRPSTAAMSPWSESQPRLLARAFPGLVSDVVEAGNRNHGVRFEFGVTVAAATLDGVRLTNGTELKADIILVGIGVDPSNAIARRSGSSADARYRGRRLRADEHPMFSAPATWRCNGSKCPRPAIRVENLANAQNQAICVAGNMAGANRE